jgi:hypothetical protein
MSNQAVTLLLVGKTEKGWRRMPVAFGRNGKIRPQYALVDGVPVHFPGSYYALRHFEGSKTTWTTVGENATDALAARDREQHLRQAKKLRNGVDARTVMAFTGHEDLATVLRYLAPAGDQPMQAKVSKIAWT